MAGCSKVSCMKWPVSVLPACLWTTCLIAFGNEFINSYVASMCWPTECSWKCGHRLRSFNLYFSVLLPWRLMWPANIFMSEEYLCNIWHLAECRGKNMSPLLLSRDDNFVLTYYAEDPCVYSWKILLHIPLILASALHYFWIFCCTSHLLQKPTDD